MYQAFFKMRMKPFELLPNPEFLFLSKSHKKALSFLDYGIRERIGFILLTGEVGSGKTTLIKNILSRHYTDIIPAHLFNTGIQTEQLIPMINDDFGLQIGGKDKVMLLRDLNSFLIKQFQVGKKPVLVIDEAQNLNTDLLEEIRMLSNLETCDAKLLQIILVGQPELRKTLALPEMVQLRQRICINCHLLPLTRSETEQYILYRLDIAGGKDSVCFAPEVTDLVFSYSRGIPRLINIICEYLMITAFADRSKMIGVEMAEDILKDLDFENNYWPSCNKLKPDGSHLTAPLKSLDDELSDSAYRFKEMVSDITNSCNIVLNDLTKKITKFDAHAIDCKTDSYKEINLSNNFFDEYSTFRKKGTKETGCNLFVRFFKRYFRL